jgi:alginate O-acetyltransferase complex protein AlgI
MAIGLGRLFGFDFPENFRYPYTAVSITDFWRRWHITLSAWFREYVYIPLGGNRKGLARQLLNLLIVWALTGLWHGAGTNFLLWGLYFFVFLALEKLFLGRLLAKLPKFVGWLYTLPVVAVSWMIFACDTPALLGSTFRALFGANGFSEPLSLYLLKSRGALLILCAVVASGLPARLWQSMKRRIGANAGTLCEIAASLPALALTLSFLIGDSYNPFLYFRF